MTSRTAALLLALSWAAITGCREDPILPIGDAGSASDKDDVDAGPDSEPEPDLRVDAGADEDTDAGIEEVSPYACPSVPEPVPFDCDGAEDFCDPLGDVPDQNSDILATWSRVEEGTFILYALFAAPPFAGRDQQFAVCLREDSDPATDDFRLGLVVNGERAVFFDCDRAWTIAGGGPHYGYPPPVWMTGPNRETEPTYLDPCAITVSDDQRLLRIPLDGEVPYPEGLQYMVEGLYPGTADDCSGEIPPGALEGAAITSRGGSPPISGSMPSICDAVCP